MRKNVQSASVEYGNKLGPEGEGMDEDTIPDSEGKKKPIDWLKQRRVIREEDEKGGGILTSRRKKNLHNWNSVLSDDKLSGFQKAEIVRERAKMIQKNAEAMEKMLYVQGNSDVNEASKVNDMFIDAIEAKLAILDNC
jgi:hypothetical protein